MLRITFASKKVIHQGNVASFSTVAGNPITMKNNVLTVPDTPVIPFIEGDGTGPDIWKASQRVFDAAVQKAYGGKRKLVWMEGR